MVMVKLTILVNKVHFWGVRGGVKTGEKENLHVHQKWACTCNFCEPNFQEFRLKWWHKELFLHCGDELNGLGPSWMVLTHGNVIFDILEPSAFQKYSICWVFRAFFCSTFFYMYFATRPRPALTAVRGDRTLEQWLILYLRKLAMRCTCIIFGSRSDF